MKFLSAVTLLAAIATMAFAQAPIGNVSVCTTCLENSLGALPLCQGLNITMGELNPGASPAFAACLCSSLDGAWIDTCTGSAQCGQDIQSFKSAYADNLQSAGLLCGGTPTFVPAQVAV